MMNEESEVAADIGQETYEPLSDGELWWFERFLSGHKLYHDPVFLHSEVIPDKDPRLLFVGNHSLLTFDLPMLWLKLRKEHGLHLRPLGEKFLYQFPGVKQYIQRSGGVEGTRENCAALMKEDQTILVYPGGAREALHTRGKAHELDWGERAGFAQMAANHNYTMIPFACVGVDDQWDYVLDNQQVADSPLGQLIKKTGIVDRDELIPPLMRGIGPTLFPKPNRHYYAFGQPMSTADVDADDPTDVWVLREDCRTTIESLIEELLTFRENDKKKDYKVRFANQLLGFVDRVRDTFSEVVEEQEKRTSARDSSA